MHGVSKNLNLARFHGATLVHICIGEFQQQFHFTTPELNLSIEGDWRIEDAHGDIVDRSLGNAQRDAYHAHRLLGRSIVGHDLAPPKSFALRFDNGWSLVVVDDSPEYESFSIQPGDIYV